MIRLLFLIMIAAIVLSVAIFQFKAVSMAKKMAMAGGAVAAAAIGVLLQTGFAWYMAILAIIAVSLLFSIVFMKIVEKEESEKLRLAEERKAKRKTLIPAATAEGPGQEAALQDQPSNKPETIKMAESSKERETIKVPEKIAVRETLQVRNPVKEPETAEVQEAKKAPESIKVRETLQVRETIKAPERELETVPARPASMQSIQPVRKER
ncbi:hypothetical protein B0H99_10853 [Planomicrobium soli]|uniref:Uncharacterized protein n=1 Tax=Planomicrobium soli TaxID=1176648 RepID=A0A2P8GMF3_9BACL|nr:hypothetical protein [Planomicrobium soli]PSL35151.1 hypothetical protein B0H99_10853 [Planomicrobium soli]